MSIGMPMPTADTDMDAVIATLERADARISDPRDWCKFRPALTAYGKNCLAISPDAVRWCATGSLARECIGEAAETYVFACALLHFAAQTNQELGQYLGQNARIEDLNDVGDHQMVRDAFREAVENAKQVRKQQQEAE